MNKRFLIALLLLAVAIVPVSIAVDLLVWPGEDYPLRPGCGIIWVGIVPVGGYCT